MVMANMIIKQCEHKIESNILETVKSFSYLGVTIKYNGTINTSSSLLMEKGRKAFFKIKKCVGFDNPCSLLEKHLYVFPIFEIMLC